MHQTEKQKKKQQRKKQKQKQICTDKEWWFPIVTWKHPEGISIDRCHASGEGFQFGAPNNAPYLESTRIHIYIYVYIYIHIIVLHIY